MYNAYYTAVSCDMSRRNLGRGNTIILVLFLWVSLLCSGTASLGTSSILPKSENPPNINDRLWTISGNWNLSVVSTCVGITYEYNLYDMGAYSECTLVCVWFWTWHLSETNKAVLDYIGIKDQKKSCETMEQLKSCETREVSADIFTSGQYP